MFLLVAISIGFFGSFHCIGMCGPIALALPVQRNTLGGRLFGILLYNLGRALTYSALGLIFGLLGKGFALFGMQQALSIALGVIILLSVLLPKKLFAGLIISKTLSSAFYKLKSSLSNLFAKKNLASLFGIGLLNGLLPCGLVYIAITGAVATGSALNGALFMALFGLGTVPAMLSLSWFKDLISIKFRSGINKTMPYLVSIMAVMMIVRGLNLGIPYLSPAFENKSKSVVCCEKPSSHESFNEKTEPDCCRRK